MQDRFVRRWHTAQGLLAVPNLTDSETVSSPDDFLNLGVSSPGLTLQTRRSTYITSHHLVDYTPPSAVAGKLRVKHNARGKLGQVSDPPLPRKGLSEPMISRHQASSWQRIYTSIRRKHLPPIQRIIWNRLRHPTVSLNSAQWNQGSPRKVLFYDS